VTDIMSEVSAKRRIQHRKLSSTWSEFVTAKRTFLSALLLCSSALGGCATYIPTEISYDAEVPPLPAPPAPLDDRLRPLHVPPLWKPVLGGKSRGKEEPEPVSRVETANSAARVEPRRRGYFNAAQI
jgi:type IV secretion system protein VirB9